MSRWACKAPAVLMLAAAWLLPAAAAWSAGSLPQPDEVIESRLLSPEVKREVATLARAHAVSTARGEAGEARRQRDAQALAQDFLRRARIEGDPRLVGYAQAALAPWRDRDDVPVDLAVLQATV